MTDKKMKGAPTLSREFIENIGMPEGKKSPVPTVRNLAKRASTQNRTTPTTINVGGQRIIVEQVTIPASDISDRTCVFEQNERVQTLLTKISLHDLIPSFKDAGQQTPGIGRKLEDGRIEIADGSRRRATALLTEQDYTVLVGHFTDEQMEYISTIGNQYLEPSAYEKGKKLARKLEQDHNGKLDRLAEAEGTNKEALRRMIETASLPEEIIKEYPRPNDLSARAGQKIAKLWNHPNDRQRSENQRRMQQQLAELKLRAKNDEKPLTGKEITDCLLAIADTKNPDKPIELKNGHGQIKRGQNGAMTISLKSVPEQKLKLLKEMIEEIMEEK